MTNDKPEPPDMRGDRNIPRTCGDCDYWTDSDDPGYGTCDHPQAIDSLQHADNAPRARLCPLFTVST